MATLGVHVYEQATSVSTPNVAKVGIPFVVGTAPVHTASKPAASNIPVLHPRAQAVSLAGRTAS